MPKKRLRSFALYGVIGAALFLTFSCTDQTVRLPSPAELLLDIQVQDGVAFPVVSVTCTNVSQKTVSLAKAFVTSGVMGESFFSIWEQFSASGVLVHADFCPSTETAPVYGHIQLGAQKSVTFSFSLRDFYSFPPDLCTSLYIAYNGPLGSSAPRTLYLHSDPYKHYGNTALSLKKDRDTVWAVLDFENTSGRDIFLPTAVFPHNDVLTEDFFAIAYATPSGEWFSAHYCGANEGLSAFFVCSDCILLKAGETFKTEVSLSDWYDLPPEVDSVAVEYYGYSSPFSTAVF